MATQRTIGDIYQLPDCSQLRFFLQHVDTDSSHLGSHVVNVLVERVRTPDLPPSLEDTQTLFYTHVALKAGETLALWKKVGRATAAKPPRILWCTYPIAHIKQPNSGEWESWFTGEERVPLLVREGMSHRELGLVMAPQLVIERAHTGKWSFVYPTVP